MREIARGLSILGRNGPVLLVISLIVGLLAPAISQFAERLVPYSAFLLTLGSFLSAALSPKEDVGQPGKVITILALVGLVVPLSVWLLTHLVHLAPSTELAVTIAALAPPVGSAAAVAAMLGLRPRLALLISMSLTLLAPVSMPAVIAAVGLGLQVDFTWVGIRLAVIVGFSALLTAGILRWRTCSFAIFPDSSAATGISVIGLVIVGLAVTSGIAPLMSNGTRAAQMLATAVGINIAACALGTLAFRRLGRSEAFTIGFLCGNRNVTLAWAVAGPSLPWDAQSYLAVCVIPVLTLPLLLKIVLRRRKDPRGAVRGALPQG